MLTHYKSMARTLIGRVGCIFIHSVSARLTSFEINSISKETSRAEPEYMNIHPPPLPINALATALYESAKISINKDKNIKKLRSLTFQTIYFLQQ